MEAVGKHALRGLVHVLVADGLVDHLAQAFRSGLGREGGALAAVQGRGLAGQALAEAVGAQGRQRNADVLEVVLIDERVQHLFHRTIIGRGQGEQAQLGFTRGLQARARDLHHRVRIQLTVGPVPISGLAEAAALGTAAHHFHRKSIVDKLHVGHQVLHRVIVLVQHFHPGALDGLGAQVRALGTVDGGHGLAQRALDHVQETRDVHAFQRGQLAQDGFQEALRDTFLLGDARGEREPPLLRREVRCRARAAIWYVHNIRHASHGFEKLHHQVI